MLQKQAVISTQLNPKQKDCLLQVSSVKKLICLTDEWRESLDIVPYLYFAENTNTVFILFEDSSFDCSELLCDCGEIIASISSEYSMSICGIIENLEMGELTAYFDNEGLWYKKTNVSGVDFDTLSNIYIRLTLNCADEFEFVRALLSNYLKSSVAFSRNYKNLLKADEFCGDHELTHFLYFKPDDEDGIFDKLSQSLTVDQLTELWILFLHEGFTAIEFEFIYEQVREKNALHLMQLELSLQLALSHLGIQITNDASGFTVHKSDGERIKFDFSSSSPAEKLLMKILFPIGK